MNTAVGDGGGFAQTYHRMKQLFVIAEAVANAGYELGEILRSRLIAPRAGSIPTVTTARW